MHNKPQLKLVFLVFASCIFIFSPLLILFIPLFFSVTFFYEKYTWVYYTPSINFLLIGIAVALLFLTCLVILIVNKKKLMYTLTAILTIAALVLIVGSGMSYLKISPDGMKVRHAFQLEEKVYVWSDMEKVEYYPVADNNEGSASYIVRFKDGETYKFNETADVELVRWDMIMMLEQNKVPYTNMDVGKVNENTSD